MHGRRQKGDGEVVSKIFSEIFLCLVLKYLRRILAKTKSKSLIFFSVMYEKQYVTKKFRGALQFRLVLVLFDSIYELPQKISGAVHDIELAKMSLLTSLICNI